jgi:hypothetical protein
LVVLQAAKRGGADPEKNVELSRALKEAHSVRLPKDNIERALKKASDASNNEDYKSGTYEIFGHGQFTVHDTASILGVFRRLAFALSHPCCHHHHYNHYYQHRHSCRWCGVSCYFPL